MNGTGFIDALERELRVASRRRIRLELARMPAVRTEGIAVVAAIIVCVVVAVPLLLTGARSAARHASAPGPSGGGSAVIDGCSHTVAGQLPADWRSARAGTVVADPIAWYGLYPSAKPGRFTGSQGLIEGLAVVNPGRAVTVSILPDERGRLSLDYTSVAPRTRFRLSDGVSSVTFRPCVGPVGTTQFDGGFIIKGPLCAEVVVRATGRAAELVRFPLGRSCVGGPVRNVLYGNGIDSAKFGDPVGQVVRRLDHLLGRRPTKRYYTADFCDIDHAVHWPALWVTFLRGRFVGYQYGLSAAAPGEPVLATAKGLGVGNTVATGERLYGKAFRLSAVQGGAWFVSTDRGHLLGYTSAVTSPKGRILSIDSGYVGCPAMTP